MSWCACAGSYVPTLDKFAFAWHVFAGPLFLHRAKYITQISHKLYSMVLLNLSSAVQAVTQHETQCPNHFGNRDNETSQALLVVSIYQSFEVLQYRHLM